MCVEEEKNHSKREKRVKKTGEVFTPIPLVRRMLSKLPKEVWKRDKTFCDPACGNGNMLLVVLWTKLAKGHKTATALDTVYGVDIMRDNIRECRLRLLKLVSLFEKVTEDHVKTVMKNVVWINRTKYPFGALEYNFSFKNSVKQSDVDKWMEWIKRDHILDDINLPVTEEFFKDEQHMLFPSFKDSISPESDEYVK